MRIDRRKARKRGILTDGRCGKEDATRGAGATAKEVPAVGRSTDEKSNRWKITRR